MSALYLTDLSKLALALLSLASSATVHFTPKPFDRLNPPINTGYAHLYKGKGDAHLYRHSGQGQPVLKV